MLAEALTKLEKHDSLTEQEAQLVFEQLVDENISNEQKVTYLTSLNAQKDKTQCLLGFVNAAKKKMLQVNCKQATLDIVGSGGDKANTFNISTGSALLLAACGISVAKNGNRSSTSLCGSADVLEALGIPIQQGPEEISAAIQKHHFAFCFAPLFHPSFKHIKPARKALGTPTLFNILGPLINPANAEYLLLGVYDPSFVSIYAEIIKKSTVKRALIFHSNGLDELTCSSPAEALLVEKGAITPMTLKATDYGLPECSLKDLTGGDIDFNANALTEVFEGKDNALANTLILNAGAGLFIYGKTESIQEGVDLARTVLKSGEVLNLVNRIKADA